MRSAVFSPEKEKSQPGEPFSGRGRGKRVRVARLGGALDVRPARIGEAEELGGLVEGLAERVVDRGAEPAIAADAFDCHELRVAAGDEEQQIGKTHRGRSVSRSAHAPPDG